MKTTYLVIFRTNGKLKAEREIVVLHDLVNRGDFLTYPFEVEGYPPGTPFVVLTKTFELLDNGSLRIALETDVAKQQ